MLLFAINGNDLRISTRVMPSSTALDVNIITQQTDHNRYPNVQIIHCSSVSLTCTAVGFKKSVSICNFGGLLPLMDRCGILSKFVHTLTHTFSL